MRIDGHLLAIMGQTNGNLQALTNMVYRCRVPERSAQGHLNEHENAEGGCCSSCFLQEQDSAPHLKRRIQAARPEPHQKARGLVRMAGRKMTSRVANRAASARNLQSCQQPPRKPVSGALVPALARTPACDEQLWACAYLHEQWCWAMGRPLLLKAPLTDLGHNSSCLQGKLLASQAFFASLAQNKLNQSTCHEMHLRRPAFIAKPAVQMATVRPAAAFERLPCKAPHMK